MDVFSVTGSIATGEPGLWGYVGLVEDRGDKSVRISPMYVKSWQAKRWALAMVGRSPGRYSRWAVMSSISVARGVVNESLPLPVASLEIPKSSRFAARGPFSGYMPGGRALRSKAGVL